MGAAATIWLVGMMGAGKSAVGEALAARLGVSFVDSDAEIERAAGASIPDIFAREGEEAFRRRERDAIAKLAGMHAVVALGGGAIVQPGAAELLEGSGTVIYLRARPETLLERVGEAARRPLLDGLDRAGRMARLRELLDERASHYERAGVTLDTDGLSVAEVVDVLVRRLKGPRH